MGGNGVETPPEPARSLDEPVRGSLANYKNWNREPKLLSLQWSKRTDDRWWLFNDVELGQLDGHGVFVVWLNGSGVEVSAVLYVGRGDLKYEFARCRRDPLFRTNGLYVTWAKVNDVGRLDDIGAYLYHQLRPLWGETVQSARPLSVNSPITA